MRAFHLLLIAFCTAIALTAAILAASLAVSLGRGFEQYLDQEDRQDFAIIVDELRNDVGELSAAGITDPDALREGMAARFDLRRAEFRARRGQDRNSGGGLGTLYPRVMLFDPTGDKFYGPPLIEGAPPRLQRLSEPIEYDSRLLATVRVLPRPPISPQADSAYISARYRAIALSALAVLILGAAVAWLAAKSISRWLVGLRDSLSAIATRRFDTQVPLGITTEQREIGLAVTEMAGALREADSRRRRWFAEVSHEIRTPLTILRGEIEAMLDGIRPLDKAALRSLHEETERLSLVTEDLRLLSLAELGEVSLNAELDDAVERCRTIAERWRKQVNEAGLTLEVATGEGPIPIVWDRHKIERVIDNLLSNALRYTNAPGTIRLELLVDNEQVTIAVEDSDPGVPSELLDEIFEPLSRALRNVTEPDSGSGLGLAIVQAVAESHGGMAGASPAKLGGLRVVVSIPRRLA